MSSSLTTLHHAVRKANLDVAKKSGLTVITKNMHGDNPLHLAAVIGNLDIVQCLVKEDQASVHAVTCDGNTPLHLATCKSRLEVAKCLVAHGADVNAVNRGGYTPLHIATANNIEMTKYLVANGASVHIPNNDGDTPLHHAAWFGNLSIVQHLVEIGKANIFRRNRRGMFPIQETFVIEIREYLKAREREQTLAAARNALHKIPDDVFMYLTTFLSV